MIDKQSAVENDFFLVNQIRKMTPDTMIVIIADNAEEDEKLLEKNIDQLVRQAYHSRESSRHNSHYAGEEGIEEA